MVSADVCKEPVKLNLGCGLNAPLGWVNIDASLTARLSKIRWLYKFACKIGRVKIVPWPRNIKIIDIRKGLPFPDNSVKAIFSSHMLEHMDYDDANFVIKECYRCLCVGGAIRIIVPDLYEIAKKYVDAMVTDPRGEHGQSFLQDLGMQDISYKGIRKVIYKVLGHSKHLYMYDQCSLRELFKKHGFTQIQSMGNNQSRISGIAAVEDKGRHKLSICLEGVKK
jgi:predicted SAM-dependent methyltransferase